MTVTSQPGAARWVGPRHSRDQGIGGIKGKALVLSIIAGARVESMTQGLKHPSIVRSMQNTPEQVAEGMTVWTASGAVT